MSRKKLKVRYELDSGDIRSADDSDGVIGGVIEESFTFIDEIIVDEELEANHKETM